MTNDAALSEIMALTDTDTPAGAVDAVRQLQARTASAPVLAIEADGALRIAKGATIGQLLRLLASAQARLEGVVVSV